MATADMVMVHMGTVNRRMINTQLTNSKIDRTAKPCPEIEPMIDLHLHILPGMDDGPVSWRKAIKMAVMASGTGTTVAAATVHGTLTGKAARAYVLAYQRILYKMQCQLKERRLPLRLVSGMEILSDGDVIGRIRRGEALTLNQSPYVLIEFEFDVPALQIYRDLDRLLDAGYIPVLAHPERYGCVRRSVDHIYEWHTMGTVIQVNKGSLLGDFGNDVFKTADWILRHRLASAVASDAHGLHMRTPDLDQLAQILEARYGVGCPRLLLWENPERILAGRSVVDMESVRI
ncbi:MAG: tyrosine-protein phosphatase [Catenibacillus sp.]